MSDIKSDVVDLSRQHGIKIKARKNETVCAQCGGMIFWVILLKDKVKIQCISCYEFLSIKGVGKGLKMLRAQDNKKLLTAGDAMPWNYNKRTAKKLIDAALASAPPDNVEIKSAIHEAVDILRENYHPPRKKPPRK